MGFLGFVMLLVDFLGYIHHAILPSWKQSLRYLILKQQHWYRFGGSIVLLRPAD